MRRLLVVPFCCATVVVGVLGSGAAGAGGYEELGRDVAKTTIPTSPTEPVPTAPVPTAPVPTVPVPTAAQPTVPTIEIPISVAIPGVEDSGLSPESVAIALPIFGLDMTKLQCVRAALPSLSSDDNLAVTALQGCGVAIMPLLRGIVAVTQGSNAYLDPTATTVALPPVAGVDALPLEDTFFLGFMLLIDTTQASCLATGLAGATTEDDATALAIFQRCEVSLAFTIDMLTFALLGDFEVDASTVTVPAVTVPVATAPVVPSVPGAPTTVVSIAPDDPMVDQFQEMLLAQQGITLDDQQAACLLSHIGSSGEIDTSDTAALFALLEACGISLTDLLPSSAKQLARTLTPR